LYYYVVSHHFTEIPTRKYLLALKRVYLIKSVHAYIIIDEEWKGVSIEAQSLVDAMLRVDPTRRISINEALKHNWFSKFLIKPKVRDDQINEFYKNIVSFKIDPKFFFQHATLAYMVHHIAKKEETDEIRKLFLYLDKKGDGKLTYSEIINGFKKCVGFVEKDLMKILKYIDHSKNNVIEYEGIHIIVIINRIYKGMH